MKKLSFFIILIFVANIGYSQFYLGKKYREVLETVLKDKTLSNIKENISEGYPTIAWFNNNIQAIVLTRFNGKDILEKYSVVYDNKIRIKTMIKYFNEKFIKKFKKLVVS